MARKRAEQTTNYWIVLTIDTDGCVVKKAFDPRAWPFDVTDVTGDVQGAVHLLQMGAPVKCVNDDAFLDDIKQLYAKAISGKYKLPSIMEAPMWCKCGWTGTVGECNPDCDGDANLGCPTCNAVVNQQKYQR